MKYPCTGVIGDFAHFHATRRDTTTFGGMMAPIYTFYRQTNTNIIYAASFVCLLENIDSKTLHFIYCPYRLYASLLVFWIFMGNLCF